jgi:hypothetical protein
MASIAGGYEAAKAAFQMLQGYSALKSEADKNAAIVDIQRHVVETQQGMATAMEEINTLKQEVVRLKDWTAEKERYELTAIGERAFVYAEKQGVENPKAPHWLCQQCFDNAHKSALQFATVVGMAGGLGQMAVWRCSHCNGDIRTGRHATPANPTA